MKKLGQTKPKLKSSVVAVFIANEENSSIPGVGVDVVVKDGLLDKLKIGPLFWIDTPDKQPCIGTGGMIPWKLHVTWKLFHSGLAHKVSATVDSQLFSHYFDDCPVIHAQGRTHHVTTYFLEDIHDSVDYKLASDSLASLRFNAPKQKVDAYDGALGGKTYKMNAQNHNYAVDLNDGSCAVNSDSLLSSCSVETINILTLRHRRRRYT
ncbi:hypothetical protein Lser_V15G39235 [Lactuca serriola]